MTRGKVKWFDEAKGFGFINSADKDYFVHYKEIKTEGFKTLKEGDGVEFDIVKKDKGWSAANVRKLAD